MENRIQRDNLDLSHFSSGELDQIILCLGHIAEISERRRFAAAIRWPGDQPHPPLDIPAKLNTIRPLD